MKMLNVNLMISLNYPNLERISTNLAMLIYN